jgi:hypothetical protein
MLTLVAGLLAAYAVKVQAQAECEEGPDKIQSGTNNYVIDLFTDILVFTYAIDKCTSTSIIPTSTWYKYTCAFNDTTDTWWATKTEYSDAACTEDATPLMTWSYDENGLGEVNHFECDGDNTYVHVEVTMDEECELGTQTVYGGLGGCALGSTLQYTKYYCEEDKSYVQFYAYNSSSSAMCETKLYCNKWTFTKECSLITNLLGNDIYGKMIECGAGSDTMAPETTESSAPVQFALLNIIVAVVASLFWL